MSATRPGLLLAVVSLCGAMVAGPARAAPVGMIDARALAAQLKASASRPVLFDVSDERTRATLGVIDGAHLLYGVVADRLGSRLPDDKARSLVFYDSGKGDDASRMAAQAIEAGYERVSLLVGGLPAWLALGRPAHKPPPAPTALSPREVLALQQAHRALLVDVREAPERREVIGESLWLPYSRLEAGDPRWSDPLQLTTQEKRVIFYCAVGIRSRRAAEVLREQGYASSYFDGPDQWRAAGLPLAAGPAR